MLRKGRFVDGGSVRKEKGADQDIGLEGLPQNWHFLTFPKHFLADSIRLAPIGY
ncbi:MAG: hypothetical protein RHS_5178 [Robinsoniella sp. RHS]|nr:MAG: hypothetical protein RHS_5178 [Robinsoniella sp. RHS]